MKAMKSMNMNRMLGSLKRRPRDEPPEDVSPETQLDTPEANAARSVRLFCESGGANGSGEEVLFLPTIVTCAESSPSAAKQCAQLIRKYLSKDNFDKPYVQYNAIMLIRILADNPGKTFTRNVDTRFVQTVKELLRVGRDPSVKQILMETLDTFEREKASDEGLAPIIEMWKKEHLRMIKIHGPGGPRAVNPPPLDPHSQNYFSRNHSSRRLPNPQELASRIEEARTSAKLLSQVVQSTPPSELLANDLIREFADRCQSASRSIQAYMIAENPAPDNATMETLIETNEQLVGAMSQHQRAILTARKAVGFEGGSMPVGNPEAGPRTASWVASQRPGSEGFAPPAGPPPNLSKPIPRKSTKGPPIPPPGENLPTFSDDEDEDEGDPFADPENERPAKRAAEKNGSSSKPLLPQDQAPAATGQLNDRLAIEPYHPGFRETESYVGRQKSSMGNATMHAAPLDDDDVVSPESAVVNTTEGSSGYGPRPGSKAPVYRY